MAPAPASVKPAPLWLGILCAAMLFAVAPAAASAGAAAGNRPPGCPEKTSLCLQAAQSGKVDLKTGTAQLEGNVRGYIQDRQLKFTADTLKSYRNKKKEWTRLVLDRNVRLTQPDTVATADHSVLKREWVLLVGDGKAERPPYYLGGHEIEMDHATRRITAKGSPQKPATVMYKTVPEQNYPAEDATPAGQPPAAQGDAVPGTTPETLFIQALHAVVDSGRDEIVLTGQVIVERPELNWRLEARTANLKFNRQRRLKSFRAEGGVKIQQPERTLGSDIALSRNNNETILLIGNASMRQPGEFKVSADRLEVYTNAKKGIVQGQDKDKPIKLAIDITPGKKKRNAYMLNDNRLQSLSGKGVPLEVLSKLKSMKGRNFPDLDSFQVELRHVLTATEAAQFMEAIISHAR